MHQLLEPAYANLARAKKQTKEFKVKTSGWVRKKPWKIKRVDVHVGNFSVWSFEVDRLPADIGSAVADAVHNIRKPLDKILTAYIAIREGHGRGVRIPGVQFPALEKRSAYMSTLKNLRKLVGSDVTNFLEHLECFDGGKNELIYHLHRLDVEEKHYPFLMPVNLATSGPSVGKLWSPSGSLLRLGSPRGQHLVALNPFGWGPRDMVQPDKNLAPTTAIIDGQRRVVFQTPEWDFEFMTTTIDAEMHGEYEPTLALKLTTEKGLVLGDASSVLEDAHLRVKTILEEFESRFFEQRT